MNVARPPVWSEQPERLSRNAITSKPKSSSTYYTSEVAIVRLLLTAAVVTAVSGIYRTALYRLAVDGRAPVAVADANLSRSFRGA
ncbi:hypothetical protein ACLMAL_35145 [Nocardia sp. CWNU-33]|uniref:hypothetical protein n=1 Tax=Nocardia sp. CWNU-33 TaxID=3392117 RepID=UPI00398E3F6D